LVTEKLSPASIVPSAKLALAPRRGRKKNSKTNSLAPAFCNSNQHQAAGVRLLPATSETMETLFGARKTPAERIKEYNRSIKK